MTPLEEIEVRKLKERILELRGEVANMVASSESPDLSFQVARRMVLDRDQVISRLQDKLKELLAEQHGSGEACRDGQGG